eukprot:CAMPEP_0116098860 /NCGR_PEP_ID=MMETSP0327-20121206/11461_1 /TAXON_ID=44447 /ORGANISM="Pseudo-nitzschia delicatissima, Strain B596" /LENGTH=462 /DNA_ID=CAMNT_0003590701 /DNA_START=78 /DNA_END=1466 /DNA_ORIENTATION=-
MKCEFTRVQLLLLIGVTTTSIGCEAFVGTHSRSKKWTLLSSTSESQDPILLEGKLHVLEDVVKELDARHKNLLEQSTVAQQEYDQKLREIEESLNESETQKGEQESSIAALEKEIADHVMNLASLEKTKDDERETKTKQLQNQNEESLVELRASFEKDVQELEQKLESKTSEAKGLSEQLETALSSTVTTETDALIKELKEQIEAQQKQLDAASETSESSESIPEDSSALEDLKALHQKVVDDYENKIDDLMAEDSQALFVLTAQHQTVVDDLEAKINALREENEKSLIELKALHLQDVEDYESRLDSIFADKEEVSSTLKAEYDLIVEDYEKKHQLAQSESEQLSSDLKAMETKSEEQVAIATAAVEASEARETSLRQESANLSRTIQMYWIAAKLANLLFSRTESELQVVTQQQNELEAENEDLHRELNKTKKGVQDLIEQLENQSNMWQKLRSKVSGKR